MEENVTVTPGYVYRDAAKSWAMILGDPKGPVITLSMIWFFLKMLVLFNGSIPYYYIDPIMFPLIVLFTARSYYSESSLWLLKGIEKLSIRIGRKNTLLMGLVAGLLLTYVGNSVFWFGISAFPGAFFIWMFIAFTDALYLYCAVTLGMTLAQDASSSTERKGIVLVVTGVAGLFVMRFIPFVPSWILFGGMYNLLFGVFCSLSAIGVPFLRREPNGIFWIAFLIIYILSLPFITGLLEVGALTPLAVAVAVLAASPRQNEQPVE